MVRNAHAGRQKKHFWLQCGAYGGARFGFERRIEKLLR